MWPALHDNHPVETINASPVDCVKKDMLELDPPQIFQFLPKKSLQGGVLF